MGLSPRCVIRLYLELSSRVRLIHIRTKSNELFAASLHRLLSEFIRGAKFILLLLLRG